MKKTLLIGAAIAVGFSGLAQSTRQAAKLNKFNEPKNTKLIDAERFPVAGTKRLSGPAHTSSVCTPNAFTSGPNAFGVGGGVTTFAQGCLMYNQDLNAYVWTHRRSQDWSFNGSTSGAIQSTWLNVGTNVWDSTIIYRDSTNSAGGRYPTGTLYNPTGNTNIANAWAVGSGPALPGGAFAGPWWAARHLTGTAADQTLPPNAVQGVNYDVAPDATFGTSIFLSNDMQQVGTKVLVTGEATDTTTSSNANHILGRGTIIGKADFSGGNPVWSHDSIIPGFYFKRDNGGNGYAIQAYNGGEGAYMAFGPNGTTGYAVMMGRLATNYGNSADSMRSPVVYKTTNGGATWAPVLLGYDWACRHPELGKNTGSVVGPVRHFEPNYRHGIDVTVDANNTLHLVTTFQAPYLDGAYADSLAFDYTYTHDYVNYHPIMWDLMTDGTDWKTMMIDSVVTSWVGGDPSNDTTASFSAITNAGTYLSYGARLQVARSTDGTKIFYSWADSDPSVTGNVFNSQPDLFMKAWDMTQNKVSASSNVTNGVAVCFFHMMADQAYLNTGNKWVCPMVYTLPRVSPSPGIYDGTAPSDHFWVNCGAYGSADFTASPVINNEGAACLIGIQTFGTLSNAVSAYPNPTNGSTKIVVALGESKNINVDVFDALGNVVFSKKVNGTMGNNEIHFDGSSLNAGVYYYTVTAGYEKVTKKLVIQK